MWLRKQGGGGPRVKGQGRDGLVVMGLCGIWILEGRKCREMVVLGGDWRDWSLGEIVGGLCQRNGWSVESNPIIGSILNHNFT